MGADRQSRGFTLIEIILVIATIGIIAAIVLLAINPNRQLAQARNIVRQTDVNTIQKALEQYIIDNGRYPNSISTTPRYICNTGVEQVGGSTNCTDRADLRELVPTYIAGIPKDPQATGANTGYNVVINPNNNKVGVSADLSENRLISINPYVINNGLVLHLDAGNAASYPGTGTTWFDLSGNNNNGTLVNGVGYNSANGGILVYDGLNDYVNIGNQNIIGSGTAPFSVEMWFYNTKNWSSGQYTMFSTLRQDTEFFVALYNGSGTLYVLPTFRGQTQWATPLTQSDYINKWICLSVVYNGGNKSSASSYITYSNGSQLPIGTVNFGGAGGSSNSNAIGIDGGSIFHQGNIGTYKVYNRALSVAEIQQNFNATKGRFGF